MIRKTPSVKNGQVILEAALVIISLATFAVASMRIFSNLNLNMTDRIDHYKDTRANAINNGGDDPLSYLYYYTHNPSTGTGSSSGFDVTFLEDPHIFDASRLLEKENNIINIILPYKIQQAYYLAKDVDCSLVDNWYPDITWVFPERIPLVKSLARECKDLANEAYGDFGNAINSFKAALGYSSATVITEGALPAVPAGSDVLLNPGPFNPAPTLAMYGLVDNQNNRDRIEAIRNQNASNREQIKNTIVSLQKAYNGGIKFLLKGNPNVPVPSPVYSDDPENSAFKAYISGYIAHNGLAQSLDDVSKDFGVASAIEVWWWEWYCWYELDKTSHQSAKEKLYFMLSYVSQLNLGTAPGSISVTLDAATKGRVKDIYNEIYGSGSVPQAISNISSAAATDARAKAQAITATFNSLGLSLLRDNADELEKNLGQAIARWDANNPPAVNDYIYISEGNEKVISVNTDSHTATLQRQIRAGELITTAGGGQGKVTNVAADPSIATIELLEVQLGLTSPAFSTITIGGKVYPSLNPGNTLYSSRGWQCKVNSVTAPSQNPTTHVVTPPTAVIELVYKTVLINYLDLKDNNLRHAQTIIRLIYTFAVNGNSGNDANLIFSATLSGKIDEIYGHLPDAGGGLFGVEPQVQTAWDLLSLLTKDAVNDASYSPELVDTHPLLNGKAEELKNRLDRALKDWHNEDNFYTELHNLNPVRFPLFNRTELQRIIARILQVFDQSALVSILTNSEKLTSQESLKILEIRSIQITRSQLLRSAYLDIWTIYRVLDCHWVGGAIFVR
ncbi:MAG: hypothetical protein NT033_07480 [Candidatus Omnitrophica bacterium]|nr:hypothetical protein [Candidatus Omnitrophota bacterium]